MLWKHLSYLEMLTCLLTTPQTCWPLWFSGLFIVKCSAETTTFREIFLYCISNRESLTLVVSATRFWICSPWLLIHIIMLRWQIILFSNSSLPQWERCVRKGCLVSVPRTWMVKEVFHTHVAAYEHTELTFLIVCLEILEDAIRH